MESRLWGLMKMNDETSVWRDEIIKNINRLSGVPTSNYNRDRKTLLSACLVTPREIIEAALIELDIRVRVEGEIQRTHKNRQHITSVFLRILWRLSKDEIKWDEKIHEVRERGMGLAV